MTDKWLSGAPLNYFLEGVETILSWEISEEMIIQGCTPEQALATLEARHADGGLVAHLSEKSFAAMLRTARDAGVIP